jgi:branched-chain amino acid transport system ATP-binding protein
MEAAGRRRGQGMSGLVAQGVSVHFGGVKALEDVSLEVPKGAIVGLIGPNGAGKTTFFNCISRFQRVDNGKITYNGRNIKRLGPHRLVRLGIARTFQNINLFRSRTTLENMLIGMHARSGNPFSAMFSLPGALRRERTMRKRAVEIAEIMGVKDILDHTVQNLSYGIRKRVELARALASEPTLILLDEPVAGCNEEETCELIEIIRSMKEDLGISILLVEHDMTVVMTLCEHIYVLDFGKNIAHGTPQEIQTNPVVIEAYLGEQDVTQTF